MTREQKLQLLCLKPNVAIDMMKDFILTGGSHIPCNRPEVRYELALLLMDFSNLILTKNYDGLRKEFIHFVMLKLMFNKKF
jgi:hypothetical protein